ncbi:hypothetical protein B0H10DRAFT_2099447, partial [Mycena sp. CBHHK59/15]
TPDNRHEGLVRVRTKKLGGNLQKTLRETHLCLIYAELKIKVISLGGVEHTFRLLRRQKISRLRAAVEELVGGPKVHLFWMSPSSTLLSSDDTPNSLRMASLETVYYVREALNMYMNSCRYTFIGAPTYTFESLRAILLVRPEIQPGFRLHYKGQEVDPTDTPEKLRALNKSGILTAQLRYTYGVETALGPEDTDVLRTEPLTPPDARRWTWREWTPPPGSVQVTPRYETRLRSGND